MKNLFPAFSLFVAAVFSVSAQEWSVLAEDVVTFSSPRPADLTGDNTLDIVIGGGVDGQATSCGITAIDGITGDTLWTVPSTDEIFGSAIFRDITGDNVDDVFIGGRKAQFYAINGSTGEIIWDVYSNLSSPLPSEPKLLNFYQGQWIPDQDNDGIEDILISYGGDHSAPVWETNRPAGMIMILSSASGLILGSATVPDNRETYLSAVAADLNNDNIPEILYGTGGETIGGGLYWASIQNVLDGSLPAGQMLLSHPSKGFIAPPALADLTGDGIRDLLVQGYDGTFFFIDGEKKLPVRKQEFPGTESTAMPVIGNFTGDTTPDIFLTLAKGIAPSYTDFYQVLIDGESGKVVFKDSLGDMVFPSPAAYDDNGDGRDEILLSANYKTGSAWTHALMLLDFQNNSIDTLLTGPGINLISTPLVTDLDQDNTLDLVYSVRKDDMDPGAPNGFYVKRKALSAAVPSTGVASGSYMGSGFDGSYTYLGTVCSGVTLIGSATASNTSCNSVDDGQIVLTMSGGTAPYTFVWSNGSVSKDLSGISDGTYTVRATDASGCIQDVTRTVSDPYVISTHAVHNTCPDGNSGQASVSSNGCVCSTSNCTYTWNTGYVGHTLTGLAPGTYYVTVKHSNGCLAYDSVTVNPAPFNLATSYIPASAAGNDAAAIVEVSGGTPPYTYLWDDALAQTNDTASGLNDGTYTVQVTDNHNCQASASVNIPLSNKKPELFGMKAYPNPSSGEVIIEIPGQTSGKTRFQIFTLQGELVREGNFSGPSGKIPALSRGIYMLRIRSEAGESVRRVVIQ